jgi:hypothetical protein
MDETTKSDSPKPRSRLWLAAGILFVAGAVRGLLNAGSDPNVPANPAEAQGYKAAPLILLLVGMGLIMFWINSLVQRRNK